MRVLELPQDYILIFFSDAQGQKNSVVNGGNRPNFELVQALMHILDTCKNEKKIQSTMKSLELPQYFSHYKSMEIF